MKRARTSVAALLVLGIHAGGPESLEAQQWKESLQGAAGEWNVSILRESGMPVIPMFEGWVANPDGTADLCFGYFNLNRSEALEIPIGPDNYIEPERYNGAQPTYFGEVPTYDNRHYCTFTVNVPQGSTERVVWHLRRDYQDYSAPGHSSSEYYTMYDLFFPSDRGDIGGAMAPVIKFLDPPGTQGIGKGNRGKIKAGPVSTRVGAPLTLSLSVYQPSPEEYSEVAEYKGDPKKWIVYWWKHSGPPGTVTFSDNLIELEPDQHTSTVTATFAEPGDYILRTSVRNAGPGGFGFSHCCWTTGHVQVTVTP